MSDEIKLLSASMKGNADAFEQIITRYQSLVCAITFSGTGRVDVSEELAQEAFLNAWMNLRQLKDLTCFKAWLCTIARNILHNYYRSRKSISCDPADLDILPDTSEHPSEHLIRQEELVMLQQTLMQLPQDYREPLVLFYRQGQSCKEVADNLGLNESTVRTRLSRARQMLREEITKRLERTLKQTAPDKTFTKAVMVTIGAIAAKTITTATATAATTAASTSSTTATTSAILSSITAKIITVAAVLAISAGVVITYNNTKDKSRTQETNSSMVDSRDEQSTELTDNREKPQQNLTETNEETVEPIAQNSTPKTTPISNNSESMEVLNKSSNTNTIQRPTELYDSLSNQILRVKVIDNKTSLPIPDARVRTYPKFNPDHYTTDETGICTIEFGNKRPDQLNLFAAGGNYTPMSISFNPSSIPVVPEDFTFELSKGTPITGHVQKYSDSSPIKGATVKVSYTPRDAISTEPEFDLRDCVHITDKDGNWQCNKTPKDLENLSIKMIHPDFAEKRIWRNSLGDDQILKRHIDATMVPGYDIKGYVTNQQGISIENASVFLGETRYYSGDEVLKTNAEGYFEFLHRTPLNNHAVVTVQAEGFAPELMNLDMSGDMQPAQFILTPAKTIALRVVDAAGDPIQNAQINLGKWRDYHSLKFLGTIDPDRFKYTDSEGRFKWTNAPEDEIQIVIGKTGYMYFSEAPLVTSDQEYEIVLYRPIRIAGNVIDSETKEPIKNFILIPGLESIEHPGNITFQPSVGWSKVFTGGNYSYDFTSPALSYAIKIEADGYFPSTSDVFYNDQENISLDFELQKGTGPTGVVIREDGTPVKNAEVCLAKGYTRIENGQIPNKQYQIVTTSDNNGHFSFPAQTDDYPILAMADAGFAYITTEEFADSNKIVLKPWARVTGDFYVGTQPAQDRLIRLSYPNAMPHNSRFTGENHVVTDKDGKFTFEKVIPGKIRLYRENYDVESGQTIEVNLGGDGRTVIGKITGPNGQLVFGNQYIADIIIDSMTNEIDPDFIPWPENFDQMTSSEAVDWFGEFSQTQQAKDLAAEMETYQGTRKRYSISYGDLSAERSFTVENVPSGRYYFNGRIRTKNADHTVNYEDIVASLYYEFEIPGITEETNLDEPFDLGLIEMKPGLKVDSFAPDFTIQNIKGGSVSLANYDGKTLLLTFYNSYQIKEQNEEIQTYKYLYNEYKENSDFAMLGIYLTQPAFAPIAAKLLEEQSIDWPHGIAEQWDSKISFEYNIKNLPYSVLIDSNGIVRAIDPDPKELKEIIEALMTNTP